MGEWQKVSDQSGNNEHLLTTRVGITRTELVAIHCPMMRYLPVFSVTAPPSVVKNPFVT